MSGRPARNKLEGLESLRWYAAAAIIIFHVAEIPEATPSRDVTALVQFLDFGVPLFYVVSAFGLWYGYRDRLGAPGQVRQFYRRRFFRIAPLFYAMLAFYIVMMRFEIDPWELLTSATFTFNLVPSHAEGIVWASWSIGVEMLFYAVMPLIAYFVTTTWRSIILFGAAVFASIVWNSTLANSTGSMAEYRFFSLLNFLYFFAAGITALLIFVRLSESGTASVRRWGLCSLAASSVAIVLLISVGHHNLPLVRAIWAIALGALTVGLSAAPIKSLVNSMTRRLGRASFSLYLLHPPIIGALDRSGVIDHLYANLGGVLGFVTAVALTFAIVVPLAFLTYRHIEEPGMKLGPRGAISDRLKR